DGLVAHLLSVGCKPEDVAAYFHLRRRTFASLYAFIAQPNPSPGEVKRLALRLALDARRPVGGDINRFTWQRLKSGWLVGESPTVSHRTMLFPLSSQLVTDPLVVLILDRVFAEAPSQYRIMEVIEFILGGPPRLGDTLEALAGPLFEYSFSSEKEW